MLADKNYKHKIQKRKKIPDEFLKMDFLKYHLIKKKFLSILKKFLQIKKFKKKLSGENLL